MNRPFSKTYLDMLESGAWRSLGINDRRLIDFLTAENMRHGGKRNGFLLAPRRQLEAYGIAPRHVSAAIEAVQRVGLIDVKRGVGRRPSSYALTWLPMADGSAPSDRWRTFGAVATTEGMSLQMTTESEHLVYPKGSHNRCSDYPLVVAKAENKGIRRVAPSKIRSYQGKKGGLGEGAAKAAVPSAPAAAPVRLVVRNP